MFVGSYHVMLTATNNEGTNQTRVRQFNIRLVPTPPTPPVKDNFANAPAVSGITIGPSLANFGITNPLLDPTLSWFDSNGAMIGFNDNWRDGSNAGLIDSTLRPTSATESAILTALVPGAYTAIVRGNGDATGVALVDVYALH